MPPKEDMQKHCKAMLAEMVSKESRHKYAAEIMGTFMLVFTASLVTELGKQGGDASATALFGPTSIGCMLMVMIYALGPISGGHFNPAVSFAMLVQSRAPPQTMIIYMIVQLASGCLAGLSSNILFGANPELQPNYDDFGATNAFFGSLVVEFMFTFMLCFVALNCSSKALEKKTYHGVAIGFVIIAGGYGGGKISGGAFNPAVVFGLAKFGFVNIFLVPAYCGSELAGALFAVFALNACRADERSALEALSANGLNFFEKAMQWVTSKFDPEDSCEFLGTLMLSFTWAINGLADTTGPGGAATVGENKGGVLSTAACLMCMIYAVGDISGGFFNPALTVAALLRFLKTGKGVGVADSTGKYGRLCDPTLPDSKTEGPKYMMYQFMGGAAGVAMTFFCTWSWPPGHSVSPGKYTADDGIHTYDLMKACFAEFFGTFVLAFVVLAVALKNEKNLQEYTAFAIGGCIIACGYGFAPVSGGVLNPALAIANWVLRCGSDNWKAGAAPCYVLAEVLGGVVAALIFKFATHKNEYVTKEGGLLANEIKG
jgi:aquaporin Z